MPNKNRPSRAEVKSVTRNTPTIRCERNNEYKSYGNKKRALQKLQEYPELQTWLKTIGNSSVNLYLNALKKFCEFSWENPSEHILLRNKETRNPDPNSRTRVRDLIFDFRTYLEKEEYAPKNR
jgi:hypothetical protein